jgi:RNA polymerase sigma-70 factor (sigma-E family)
VEDFEGYVTTAWPRLLRSAWLLTHDWYLAEDLLQTTLAKVAPRWPAVGAGAGDAYVRRALANTYLSWWHRRWRGELPTAQPPDQPEPGHAEAVSVRTALAQVLATLPRQQRAVLMLRYHADLTEAATAAALGISVGAVKSHTARALAALRDRPGIRSLFIEEATP